MLQVDFATETLLVTDGRRLFVCNGKNGAVKRKHTFRTPTRDRANRQFDPDWKPSFAIIPGRNMYTLCQPDDRVTLHLLNEPDHSSEQENSSEPEHPSV